MLQQVLTDGLTIVFQYILVLSLAYRIATDILETTAGTTPLPLISAPENFP